MKLAEFCPRKSACDALGIPWATLIDAIERQDVRVYYLGDGSPVVRLAEVEAWDETRQKGPGRPKVE